MDTKSEKSLILKDYYTNLAGSIPAAPIMLLWLGGSAAVS